MSRRTEEGSHWEQFIQDGTAYEEAFKKQIILSNGDYDTAVGALKAIHGVNLPSPTPVAITKAESIGR